MSTARIIGVLAFTLAAGCNGVADAPPPPESREEARAPSASIEPRPAPKAIASAAKAPAKLVASPASVEQPRKVEVPVPAAKPSEPSLDVAALTTRLRDTNAIGVFTKLALKNQVDDLLKQFRAYHQGGQKTGVASLRQPYNMLLLKVLSLVQDSDPSLARAISGSREAIWSILADPEKFKSVA